MVILGHPLYAGGGYQGTDEADSPRIHRLLRKHEVRSSWPATRTTSSTTGKTITAATARGRCITSSTAAAARISASARRSTGRGGRPCRTGRSTRARRPSARSSTRDAGVETAGVVVDQALQRLAGLGGSALRHVRLQPSPVLSELHGSSRGGLCATRAIDTAWRARPAPLARCFRSGARFVRRVQARTTRPSGLCRWRNERPVRVRIGRLGQKERGVHFTQVEAPECQL